MRDLLSGALARNLRNEIELLEEAISAKPMPLDQAPSERGAYLLLYAGQLPIYKPISHGTRPIYVGKAENLAQRMADHLRSIDEARDLRASDFHAVFCPQPTKGSSELAEYTFVCLFRPVWNQHKFRGFGSHNQGKIRTHGQTPSPWDRAHPGRHWTRPQLDDACTPYGQIRKGMKAFLNENGGWLPTWTLPGQDPKQAEPGRLYLLYPGEDLPYRLAIGNEGVQVVWRADAVISPGMERAA